MSEGNRDPVQELEAIGEGKCMGKYVYYFPSYLDLLKTFRSLAVNGSNACAPAPHSHVAALTPSGTVLGGGAFQEVVRLR